MVLNCIAEQPLRLSLLLKRQLHMSAGLINRAKWQGQILVNGIPRHTDFVPCVGDAVTVQIPEPEICYPAEPGALTVLYEDDALLAVDKPAGMLIHPSRATVTGTLANRVAAYYQSTGQNCAFHPLTRLDRDTYGIVLLAKNAHIHAVMSELHRQGAFRKTYHALTFGAPKDDSGVIDAPIARRPLPSLLRYVNQDGKPSRTQYTVLCRGSGWAKLALIPVTGRTHQLRVHCAYMGCPILGDPQYASGESAAFSRQLGMTAQALCAKELSLPHPVTGEQMTLTSRMDVPEL